MQWEPLADSVVDIIVSSNAMPCCDRLAHFECAELLRVDCIVSKELSKDAVGSLALDYRMTIGN